jgi:hypothetical protein
MLLLALLACGLTEKNYDDQFAQVYCARQFECNDAVELSALYADEAACRDLLTSGAADEDACQFDTRAANDCLDALEAATCDDFLGPLPAACTQVCG